MVHKMFHIKHSVHLWSTYYHIHTIYVNIITYEQYTFNIYSGPYEKYHLQHSELMVT